MPRAWSAPPLAPAVAACVCSTPTCAASASSASSPTSARRSSTRCSRIFVTTVLGAPVAVLGLIEGIAEATASITSYPFGQAADYTGRRTALRARRLRARRASASWCSPSPPSGRWRWPAASSTASARACARRRATTSSRRTRGPSSRGWPSACTAPWTRMGAVVGPLIALPLMSSRLVCAGSSPSPSCRGSSACSSILLFVREHREQPQRARLPPLAAGLAGLSLAAGRLPDLRRRQLERHVHPAQGQGRAA